MDIEYFTQILQDYGLSEKSFNVVTEPEYSKLLLLNFEKKYKISTKEFLYLTITDLNDGDSKMAQEDIDIWYQAYDDFVFFEGDLSEINSNRQSSSLSIFSIDEFYQHPQKALDNNYLTHKKKEGEYSPSFFYGLHTTC